MEGGEMKTEKKDECRMMNDELPHHRSSFIIHHSSLPSTFRLLVDPPAWGAWNMAVDDALLETAVADGRCTVRFYRWQEPTLSLGYFQPYAERWRHAASRRCAVVRRCSGGGAILHDAELTYSFAVPNSHPLALSRLHLYRAVHSALIEAIAGWGVEATMFERSDQRPLPDSAGQQPFLCFQRRSPGDVLVGGMKVAGSAQRRRQGAVLQHGSVLLAGSAAAPELDGLRELTGKSFRAEELLEAWCERLAATLRITWLQSELSAEQRQRATLLTTQKYLCLTWTHRLPKAKPLTP
jgi:lipoate-protein ligase A